MTRLGFAVRREKTANPERRPASPAILNVSPFFGDDALVKNSISNQDLLPSAKRRGNAAFSKAGVRTGKGGRTQAMRVLRGWLMTRIPTSHASGCLEDGTLPPFTH